MNLKTTKMKKTVFILAALILLSVVRVNAQPQNAQQQVASVINYSSLEKKLEKSNKNIEHAKRSTKVKTWTDHAELLIDIYNVHNDVLFLGMTTQEAKIMMQNPDEIKESQDGADLIQEYVYDRVTLKFRNDELEKWTETKPIVENPLQEARTAIDKAIELNDGSDDKSIADAINKLKSAYEWQAIINYENKDFDASYDCFMEILNLNELPVMDKDVVDSLIIYNAGRTAMESNKYGEAVEHFQRLESMDYNEPFLYIYYEQSLMAAGDTVKAVEVIQKGFGKYPDNQIIMNEMINYYITTEQPDEALKLLSVAKNRDPENVSYYFAEAVMYEKLENFEEAESVYKKCLEIDPEYFNAAYNLGVLYYNSAVNLYEEASLTADNNKFQELDTQGDEMLKKAVPYMERANEIDPADIYVLDNLRKIYYRLEMTDEYNDVVEKLKALE